MTASRKSLRLLRNLDELATYLLSYLCDTENRSKIISTLEGIYTAFNTRKHVLKGYMASYYADRLNDIPVIISELKSIKRYADENPGDVEYHNRRWLIEIVKFFHDDRWDRETRPGVLFLRAILKEFTLYEQKYPLPLGLAMETLYDCFHEQACIQAKLFFVGEEQKQALQRTLKTIGHKEPVAPLEIKKSYEAPARKQIDFEKNGDLQNVKNALEEIFNARKANLEAKAANKPIKTPHKPRVRIKIAKDADQTQARGSLFDELNTKLRSRKAAAEPDGGLQPAPFLIK